MQRAASILHSQQRFPEAWLAFSQIAETADTPATEAQARVELAGLAFELVTRGKCNWEDVRAYAAQAVAVRDAPMRQKATAELMHLGDLSTSRATSIARSPKSRASPTVIRRYTANTTRRAFGKASSCSAKAGRPRRSSCCRPSRHRRFRRTKGLRMRNRAPWRPCGLPPLRRRRATTRIATKWLDVLEKQAPCQSRSSLCTGKERGTPKPE